MTEDGRYAFTTNFADGAVSRWAIAGDGSLTLEDAAAGVAVDGQPGLRDEDLSGDGRFLYAVDADSRTGLRLGRRERRQARAARVVGGAAGDGCRLAAS